MISVQDGQNRILTPDHPQHLARVPPAWARRSSRRRRGCAGAVRRAADRQLGGGRLNAVGSSRHPRHRDRDLRSSPTCGRSVFDGALTAGETVRIMTGAPMARGADTVYPQEVVTKLDGGRVRVGPIAKGTNVRMRGEDIHAGTIVIERGTVLRPQEIGLIASLGQVQVPVHRRPRVVLLSTGGRGGRAGSAAQAGQNLRREPVHPQRVHRAVRRRGRGPRHRPRPPRRAPRAPRRRGATATSS